MTRCCESETVQDWVVGDTLVYDFVVSHDVDGESQAFDPATLKVSMLMGTGPEVTVVYGEDDPTGNVIIRGAEEGAYQLRYVWPLAGSWRMRILTTEVIAGKSWPGKTQEELFRVGIDHHQFIDR